MKRTNLFIFVLLISLLSFGCSETDRECDDSAPHLEVKQEIGTMRFNDQANSWSISRYIPNSIDGKEYFLVEDIDNSFKQDGIRVRFSGDAVRSSFIPQNAIGGEEYYCITLTDIEEIDAPPAVF